MKQVTILDCPFHQVTFKETLAKIEEFIRSRQTHQLVVVNAAKLIKMRRDHQLREIVQTCDLIGVDGVPVIWAGRLLGKYLPERINGTDLMDALIELSATKNYRLYFLGAREEVLNTAIKNVLKKYPTANIVGWRNGYFAPTDESQIIANINQAEPDILFVGMSTPQKEFWVRKHLSELKVPIIHGVGGSIDVLAGHTQRAPLWMQKNGLEWFYRFLQEPGRLWKRYLFTNSEFVYLILKAFVKQILFSDESIFEKAFKKFTSKYSWYFYRLKTMPHRELLFRLQQTFTAQWEKIPFHRPPSFNYRQAQIQLVPFFQLQQVDLGFFRNNSPVQEFVIQPANQACEHRFSIFETENVQFGDPIDWHFDFSTGKKWPLKFYSRLSYRSTKTGSSKWIMELNRHQHFFALGQAYLLTQDAEYADEIITQMMSWIKQNPYLKGIHWYSGLEMALRLISWSFALNALREYEGLTPKFRKPILRSLYAQADFIARHHVRHSSANNHLIGEATGLVVAAFLFQPLNKANEWLSTGLTLLFTEIPRQILEDGMSAEQSTHYLIFVLEFINVASSLLIRHQQKVPEIIINRLKMAAEFIRHLRNGNQDLPDIGDGDDGLVYFPNAHINHLDSLLNSIGIICEKPTLCGGNWENDYATFWWWHWHPNYLKCRASVISPPEKIGSKIYTPSGYFLMENSNDRQTQRLLFDCSPLGLAPMAAHGHADALSLYLALQDEPILIDPGTYVYYRKLEWKNYFRGSSAHNTLTVDGKDQSEIASFFVWRNQAQVNVLQSVCESQFDFIQAEHNGYARLRFPIMHRRHLIYVKNSYWIVIDLCYGGAVKHDFEQNFHFADNGVLTQQEHAFTFEKQNMTFQIIPMTQSNLSTQIYQGNFDPIRGWCSARFHEIHPTTTLTIHQQAYPPTTLGVVLWPGYLTEKVVSVQKLPIQAFECDDFAHLAGLQIEHSAGVDYLFTSPGKNTQVQFANFFFAGQMIWLRKRNRNEITRLVGLNVKRLRSGKKNLLNFEEFQPVVQI